MFVGSLSPPLQALLAEVGARWTDVEDVWVGCSGNFTVERVLSGLPGRRFRLHSNDVSLYSCALGALLSGQRLQVRIRREEWRWLEPYVQEPADLVATLMLATTMLDGLDRDNPFFARRREAYRRQWPRLHQETVERVERAAEGVRLEEFWAGDVLEHLERAPQDAAVVAYPPTYTGGYERLYRGIDAVFDWERPQYEPFDEDGLEQLVRLMREKRHWLLAYDRPVESLAGSEIGLIQRGLRSKPVFVYADAETRRLVTPQQKIEPLAAPRADEMTVIGPDSRLSVARISLGQLNLLRSLYLNPGIAPASSTLALAVAVAVDGRLIGALGLYQGQYNVCDVYLMSDFPVRPLRYRRASKLVLAAALSREVQILAEQALAQKVRTIATTAFTNRASSMKYRGLFEVYGRKDGMINYVAQAGRWSLQEGLQWWLTHHATTN